MAQLVVVSLRTFISHLTKVLSPYLDSREYCWNEYGTAAYLFDTLILLLFDVYWAAKVLGSVAVLVSSFLRKLHLLPIITVLINISIDSVSEFVFLHSLASICDFYLFDNNYCNWCKVLLNGDFYWISIIMILLIFILIVYLCISWEISI